MSFFDDAVSAAKTVGKSVGKRTEEILIISKKKLEAIELENKLNGLYENLGKLYFSDIEGKEGTSAGDTEKYDDIVNDVKKVTIRLDELRIEIEDLSKNN
jgi:hypothetical protein